MKRRLDEYVDCRHDICQIVTNVSSIITWKIAAYIYTAVKASTLSRAVRTVAASQLSNPQVG
jgi:hypothetical protein